MIILLLIAEKFFEFLDMSYGVRAWNKTGLGLGDSESIVRKIHDFLVFEWTAYCHYLESMIA